MSSPFRWTRPAVHFTLALALTVLYVVLAVVISDPWRSDLNEAIGPVASWAIPLILAYIPGFFVGFMLFSLLLSHYRPPALVAPEGPWTPGEWPPVTVLIAAFDEEVSIGETIKRLAQSNYPGDLDLVLADNGSTDRTAQVAADAARECGISYRYVFEPEPGKFRALDTALELVSNPVTVTLDADTYPHPDAVTYLVARVCERPQGEHVSACAGALIVENVSQNLLTRMQGWDFRLAINGVKGMQASYNSTLVARVLRVLDR